MTPMTVTGDKAKLMTLQYSLKNLAIYLTKLGQNAYPESYKDTLEWLSVVEQAISDQEFEQNRLPINS